MQHGPHYDVGMITIVFFQKLHFFNCLILIRVTFTLLLYSTTLPVLQSDFYSLFLHDAMMVYARAATEAGTISDGKAIFNKAKGRLYTGQLATYYIE